MEYTADAAELNASDKQERDSVRILSAQSFLTHRGLIALQAVCLHNAKLPQEYSLYFQLEESYGIIIRNKNIMTGRVRAILKRTRRGIYRRCP